jgi:SAM-dependent methyltransferase
LPELYDRRVRSDPAQKLVEVPSCIVCDETRARTTYRVEGVEAPIVVCYGCGLGRYHPMPDDDEVTSFYSAEYYGEPGTKFRPVIEKLVRLVGQRHVAFLSRDLSAGARVLDIGCGRGVLLDPLMELGFEAHGIELTEEAVDGADPRAEIRIAGHVRDAGYADEFFEEIILWHVLEPLPDPGGTLKECCRIMKPGGRIIVSLPNFGSFQSRVSGAAWFHLDPPRHLFHFPTKALSRLLERCGFECESVHHFSLRQNPFGWIQSALNRFSRLPRNALYSYLYQTDPAKRPKLGRAARLGMWSFFLAASPFAFAISVLMAAARNGATIHVVAHRQK